MANYFSVQDRPDLGGVMFTRIVDPATAAVAAKDVVYLDADPTGTWQDPPAVCKKIPAVTSKLQCLVAYTPAP